jgi:hypothetical protein
VSPFSLSFSTTTMSSAQFLVIILCWGIERYPAVQCCCKSPFSFSAEQIKRKEGKEDWKDEIERFLYIKKKPSCFY